MDQLDIKNKFSEREKIELREKAYNLALRISYPEGYNSTAEWIDFKSREIYRWLLTGED